MPLTVHNLKSKCSIIYLFLKILWCQINVLHVANIDSFLIPLVILIRYTVGLYVKTNEVPFDSLILAIIMRNGFQKSEIHITSLVIKTDFQTYNSNPFKTHKVWILDRNPYWTVVIVVERGRVVVVVKLRLDVVYVARQITQIILYLRYI